MFLPILYWYLVISVLGLVSFPLAFRLLPSLSDRGYALSRTIGLLLWAYIFWILSSLGVLANNIGGYVVAFAALLGLSAWAVKDTGLNTVREWLKKNKKQVWFVEGLFAAAFILMLLMRSIYPDIVATEKPMELAFINSILRSPSMPPHDPWLADYAISYYYFGFVMVAMLAQVTGISASVAFNLGISLVFALTAIGAYGIMFNLLSAYRPESGYLKSILSFLAPLFVLVISNMEGFLEYIHARGTFWSQNAAGEWVSSFWNGLGIKDLVNPPIVTSPDGSLRFWWWWRASRVINDTNLAGNEMEVIDEFPFFSFFLADLHPHVLVMPFVFLALGLTLHLFLESKPESFKIFKIEIEFSREFLIFAGVTFGGLAFLNIWDFPLYVGLFSAIYLLRRWQSQGWEWARLKEFISIGLILGAVGAVLYLPFYLGFSSQAGGILPNLINPTNGLQFWVMFGTLLTPIFLYLLFLSIKKNSYVKIIMGILAGLGVIVFLWLFSLLLTLSITSVLPLLGNLNEGLINSGANFINSFSIGGLTFSLSEILENSFSRRLGAAGSWLTLALLIGLALGLIFNRKEVGYKDRKEDKIGETILSGGNAFVVMLVLFGGLLVLIPEFVFLRDNFGSRMNTIFKFYIQAWLLFGTAAAFGTAVLILEARSIGWRLVYSPIIVSMAAIGLVYPVMGISTKLDDFRNQNRSLELDGTVLNQDDLAAVNWLNNEPLGTLVEAVGGSYSPQGHGRISAYSGQPTLLGWPGHEIQWRGGGEEMGSRQSDVDRLYTTGSWVEASAILDQYNIQYVYVGQLENNTYAVSQLKFDKFLDTVFQQGSVTIYRVP